MAVAPAPSFRIPDVQLLKAALQDLSSQFLMENVLVLKGITVLIAVVLEHFLEEFHSRSAVGRLITGKSQRRGGCQCDLNPARVISKYRLLESVSLAFVLERCHQVRSAIDLD